MEALSLVVNFERVFQSVKTLCKDVTSTIDSRLRKCLRTLRNFHLQETFHLGD